MADQREVEALEALAHVPLPVVVVAAADATRSGCSTGTLTYVSMRPALVVVPLLPTSNTCSLILSTGELSVSILRADQAEIASRAAGASKGSDKFASLSIPTEDPPHGRQPPAVAGALAVLWCDVMSTEQLGDHILCVGQVAAARVSGDPNASPLTRFTRSYHGLAERLAVRDAAQYPL